MNKVTKRVNELLEAGTTKAKIKATIILEDLVATEAEANTVVKEVGVTRTGATGLRAIYYDKLVDGEFQTRAEAEAYLLAEGSENTKRHLSHFLGVYDLVARIKA